METQTTKPAIFITGAAGYVGQEALKQLAARPERYRRVVAMDIREVPVASRLNCIDYLTCDIRSPDLAQILAKYQIDVVVHLAAIVSPASKKQREFAYSVDVVGTQNLLEACIQAGVRKIIVTSSGAAYGYHADHPAWLVETDPLRGNEDFAYAYHKRLIEDMLANYREKAPQLQQLIFRPGTVLGKNVDSPVTRLFDLKIIPGLWGSRSAFVFIWDQDVAACLLKGIYEDKTGIYNLAGDGTMSLREIARLLHKPYIPLPPFLVKAVLWFLNKLSLTPYGPAQVKFLRYRPVLSNQKLKREFGYMPMLSSRQAFERYLAEKGKIPFP